MATTRKGCGDEHAQYTKKSTHAITQIRNKRGKQVIIDKVRRMVATTKRFRPAAVPE
jgi:hypothetical protein